MDDNDLRRLSEQRATAYRKDLGSETFLDQLNEHLHQWELDSYEEQLEQEHPIFMVIGAPRNGTTFCTQALANAFRLNYINNLEARFYKNPVTAIKLSQQILGSGHLPSFKSKYAKTDSIKDIHEFGYFWRYWLLKDSLDAMRSIEADEAKINWEGLKTTLLNMMQVWQGPAVFKNIFGSYHMERLADILPKVIFVYIERDRLDAAESIYNARLNYYGPDNLKKWWSYSPPNVHDLLDLEPMEQIVAQLHYLKVYYNEQIEKLNPKHIIRVNYKDLSLKPQQVTQSIRDHVKAHFNYQLDSNSELPEQFTYVSRDAEPSDLRQSLAREFEKIESRL